MASKGAKIKTSAIETHTTAIGNSSSYRKSNDDFGVTGSGFGSGNGVGVEEINEMDMAESVPSRIELATALQKIEGRKTKWYAYLTTKDFWIVIILGYVISPDATYLLHEWMLTSAQL
jgi:solute carrier family 35, member F1/2